MLDATDRLPLMDQKINEVIHGIRVINDKLDRVFKVAQHQGKRDKDKVDPTP